MKPAWLQAFYEDEHIFVCLKPPQIATQCSKVGSPDMVSLIKNYLFTSHNLSKEPYLAVIHRLDQPVSGIIVFAKTPFAAKELNKQLQIRIRGGTIRYVSNSPDMDVPSSAILSTIPLLHEQSNGRISACAHTGWNSAIQKLGNLCILKFQT